MSLIVDFHKAITPLREEYKDEVWFSVRPLHDEYFSYHLNSGVRHLYLDAEQNDGELRINGRLMVEGDGLSYSADSKSFEVRDAGHVKELAAGLFSGTIEEAEKFVNTLK